VTPTPPDQSLESLAKEIDNVATEHGTTRAEVLKSLIKGLEERIAEDTAVLALARRIEAGDRMLAETAFEAAIDIVARGGSARAWRGK